MDENYIINANFNRYSNGIEVDNYLQEKYHFQRIQNGIILLEKLLYFNFPNFQRENIKILEIGGSTGQVSISLRKMGYSVVLSDVSEEALNKAKKRLNGLQCIQMDASEKFPFADNTFHAIFAGDIIEHLFDSRLFISECARCLKNNGVLLLTTPNLATLQDRLRFFIGKSPRQIDPLHEYLYLHIRPFTVSKLKELCEKYKFTGFKVKTNTVLWRIKNKKISLPVLGRLFPSLGGSIIMGCHIKK